MVAALERAADAALRGAERVDEGGWTLRADGRGVVRRANSVLPVPVGPSAAVPEGAAALAARVARVEAWYRARGRPARFQLSPAAEPEGLAAALASAGYRLEVPVLVLTRPLDPASDAAAARDDGTAARTSVDVADAPSAAWAAAYTSVLPEAERDERLRLAAASPEPRAFAALGRDACGLAVRHGAWLGVFDVATRPEARGRGAATRVTRALVAWGAARGARSAYLQVAEDNAAARALYARLGFVAAYRYVYARAPDEPQPRS